VNAPNRVAQAEYKPRQLSLARRVGLTVPPTLITNRPDDVAAFAEESSDSMITKVLYARMPRDTDGFPKCVVYTAEVSPDRYLDPSITATAHLFQARVGREYDVRITVVGHQLFAAAIHRSQDDGELDWRRNYRSIRYQPCEVPTDVADGVRRLMGLLDLAFGALDFIVTPEGRWVLLEINPNGQWYWIERETGLPISKAMAELLKGSQ
jgi:glutathione synthase/RimK-type ligase-like ATP-grasp enzyme